MFLGSNLVLVLLCFVAFLQLLYRRFHDKGILGVIEKPIGKRKAFNEERDGQFPKPLWEPALHWLVPDMHGASALTHRPLLGFPDYWY